MIQFRISKGLTITTAWHNPIQLKELSIDRLSRYDGYAKIKFYYLASLYVNKTEISYINLETIRCVKSDII